jgi:hypothetical protein
MNPRIVPKGLGYLATPYTKYQPSPSAAYTSAAKLAGLLMRCGHTVFSPIVHGHPIAEIGKIDPLDYKLWRTLNRLIVPGCDYLIIGQLAGWDKSTGLAEEIIWFEQMRKPIYHCDPQSLVLTPRYYPGGAIAIERWALSEALHYLQQTTRGVALANYFSELLDGPALAHDKTPSEHAGASA